MVAAKDVPAFTAAAVQYLNTPDYVIFVNRMLTEMYRTAELAYSQGSEGRKDMHSVANFCIQKHMEGDYSMGQRWCDRIIESIKHSKLYHVSESMTQVARVAARQFPKGTCYTIEDLPSMSGFLVLEKPILFEVDRSKDPNGRDVECVAFAWQYKLASNVAGTSALGQNLYTNGVQHNVPGVEFTTFAKSLSKDMAAHLGPLQITQEYFVREGETLDYLMGEDEGIWPISEQLATLDPETTGSMSYLSESVPLFLLSVFSLMEQTITTIDEHEDTRLARRVRQNKAFTPPLVTVVTLRHENHYGQRDESTGNWLTYRYIRSGHWRMQPYGPRHDKKVKKIWISPTMVGDPNLPFHEPIRVTSLKR